MKKFVFRLEALLRIRRVKEEEAQNKLSQAMLYYQQELAALQHLEQKRDAFITDFRQSQSQVQQVELLKNYHYYFDKLNRDIVSQQSQVLLAEEKRDHCIRELDEAAKNRKLVEKLKEQRRAEYDHESLRQEQTVLDELGMQVFMRNN